MDDDRLESRSYALDPDYRAPLLDFDPDASPLEVLEPKDYVLAEPTALTEFRERLDDCQFQIEVVKARVAAIGSSSLRLVRVATAWADKSAHGQLGAYPWIKLGGAFAATFVVNRAFRRLPFGAMASIALPLILGQTSPANQRRRR